MGLFNMIEQRRLWKKGVVHATLNPDGPGAVRIHLVPPKYRLFGRHKPFAVIVNGYYILPIGYSWAVLLSHFLEDIAVFSGEPVSEARVTDVINKAAEQTSKVFPGVPTTYLAGDLKDIIQVFYDIALEKTPQLRIGEMSLRQYAPSMTAPHRMDLMVSSMSDEKGRWHCNQKCTFCYAADGADAKEKELSTKEWKYIIDACKKAHIPQLTFTGGEPTLRPDLVELIDYSQWFVTRLNTNGLLLTPTLCQRLKEASLDSVQVTLYSADPSIHNELVGAEGKDNHALTVNGIKNALSAGLNVSVNTPLCKKNADFVATLSFLREIGVRFVSCSGLIFAGGAATEAGAGELSKEELTAVLSAAADYCHETGIEISFTSPGLVDTDELKKMNISVPMCGACLSNMGVAPDGKVVPCQSWLDGKTSLGNMLTDKWKTIWNSSDCKKIRRMPESEALFCPFRIGQKEGKNG